MAFQLANKINPKLLGNKLLLFFLHLPSHTAGTGLLSKTSPYDAGMGHASKSLICGKGELYMWIRGHLELPTNALEPQSSMAKSLAASEDSEDFPARNDWNGNGENLPNLIFDEINWLSSKPISSR